MMKINRCEDFTARDRILTDGAREMITDMVIEKVKSLLKIEVSVGDSKGKVLYKQILLHRTIKNSRMKKLIKGLAEQEVNIYYHCIDDKTKVEHIKAILNGDEKDIISIAKNVIFDIEELCEEVNHNE